MKTTICKTIEMPAFGKARPRVTRHGTFMPRAYEKQKYDLRMMFGPVPDGLVSLSIIAVRAMPKSWSKAKREQMRFCYASPKPDLDNIFGGVMDALFDEDSRVVAFGPSQKIWGDEHQLIIEVSEV